MGVVENAVARLAGKSIYFDTNPIIYFIDRVPVYFELCLPMFQALDAGHYTACTGDLCLAELLVKPIRDKKPLQVRNIKNLFDDGFIQLLPHTRDVLELAAEIRADGNLKMVDAIHAATALHNRCDVIVTGDKAIAKKLLGLQILDINDWLALT